MEKDVYYEPEHFGLTQIAEIDSGGSYEFDMTVVWEDKDGNFYFASDSGCSCPSPFERATSLADLTRFTLHDFGVLEQEVTRHSRDKWGDGCSQEKIRDFLNTVKKAMTVELVEDKTNDH